MSVTLTKTQNTVKTFKDTLGMCHVIPCDSEGKVNTDHEVTHKCKCNPVLKKIILPNGKEVKYMLHKDV